MSLCPTLFLVFGRVSHSKDGSHGRQYADNVHISKLGARTTTEEAEKEKTQSRRKRLTRRHTSHAVPAPPLSSSPSSARHRRPKTAQTDGNPPAPSTTQSWRLDTTLKSAEREKQRESQAHRRRTFFPPPSPPPHLSFSPLFHPSFHASSARNLVSLSTAA